MLSPPATDPFASFVTRPSHPNKGGLGWTEGNLQEKSGILYRTSRDDYFSLSLFFFFFLFFKRSDCQVTLMNCLPSARGSALIRPLSLPASSLWSLLTKVPPLQLRAQKRQLCLKKKNKKHIFNFFFSSFSSSSFQVQVSTLQMNRTFGQKKLFDASVFALSSLFSFFTFFIFRGGRSFRMQQFHSDNCTENVICKYFGSFKKNY